MSKEIPPGVYGDGCPVCWKRDRESQVMRELHCTKVFDYSAPKHHNGKSLSAIEWCSRCGTVRQIVRNEPHNSARLFIVGEDDG